MKNNFISFISVVFLLNKNVLTETWDGKFLSFLISKGEHFFVICYFGGWELIYLAHSEVYLQTTSKVLKFTALILVS